MSFVGGDVKANNDDILLHVNQNINSTLPVLLCTFPSLVLVLPLAPNYEREPNA